MAMTITQNDICQLNRAIGQSTLPVEVPPIAAPSPSAPQACIIIGRVQITGAWRGTALLECSEELAKKVARVMQSDLVQVWTLSSTAPWSNRKQAVELDRLETKDDGMHTKRGRDT